MRPGNAGSNTAADHVKALGWTLDSLPPRYHPNPQNPDTAHVLIRSDSAGATYAVPAPCRDAGVGFALGATIDARVRDAVEVLTTSTRWSPAITTDGGIRDGAGVAEATALVDLSTWPTGTRLILRKQRPRWETNSTEDATPGVASAHETGPANVIGLGEIVSKVPAKVIPHSPVSG